MTEQRLTDEQIDKLMAPLMGANENGVPYFRGYAEHMRRVARIIEAAILSADRGEPVAQVETVQGVYAYVLLLGPVRLGDKLYTSAPSTPQPALTLIGYQISRLLGNPAVTEPFWNEWTNCTKAEYEHALATPDYQARVLYASHDDALATPQPDTVQVPRTPSIEHLSSIAFRYRHDFGLMPPDQQENIISFARQMYEECTGQGFYRLPKESKE